MITVFFRPLGEVTQHRKAYYLGTYSLSPIFEGRPMNHENPFTYTQSYREVDRPPAMGFLYNIMLHCGEELESTRLCPEGLEWLPLSKKPTG